jgi:hypothetical protein
MKIETLSIIEMMSVNAMNTCNKLCVMYNIAKLMLSQSFINIFILVELVQVD